MTVKQFSLFSSTQSILFISTATLAAFSNLSHIAATTVIINLRLIDASQFNHTIMHVKDEDYSGFNYAHLPIYSFYNAEKNKNNKLLCIINNYIYNNLLCIKIESPAVQPHQFFD